MYNNTQFEFQTRTRITADGICSEQIDSCISIGFYFLNLYESFWKFNEESRVKLLMSSADQGLRRRRLNNHLHYCVLNLHPAPMITLIPATYLLHNEGQGAARVRDQQYDDIVPILKAEVWVRIRDLLMAGWPEYSIA